ncbi:MAG TPA: YfhO family protein [Thermoanaerobaculia bacterium]|nr:YfhO family protein [Thermoanaerobaculia bacterium]
MFNATWLYVGAIYAVAVWLVRRAGIDLPWRIAAFFYLLVLIFLFRPLTSDVVNLPVDFLRTLAPWSFLTRDHHTINPEINDLVLQIVPWAHQVRESWLSGHIPLWNNMSGSGYPLLANAQSSALSPLRILALPLTLGQSFAAEAAMKFLIALTFTYLFCRRRYSEIASAAAAVCFAFCSFIVVWLHFPLATVAVFVPAALYQIDLIAERRTYPRFVFAAILWMVMIFSGHPETIAHIFFISLLYLLWIVFVERSANLKLIVTLGGALVVAALLAAPFLATFAEALTKSRRYSELRASPNVIGYYSDWASIVLLIQPRYFGEVPFEKPRVSSVAAESITGFAGLLGIAAWFTLAIHVIRARAWRSREFFFVIATLVVLGIVLGWPGLSQLFHLVFKLAANARLRLLLCFLLAVQTAAVIDLLQRDARAVLAGFAVCSGILIYLVYGVAFPNAAAHDTAVLALLPSVAVLALACFAALPRYRDGALMVLLMAIVAEVWGATNGWNPTIRAAEMYAPTPLIEKLQTLKAKQPATAPFRIVGTGPVFFPNVSAMFGLEDIRAHDPMANGRYLGMLRVLTGYDTEDYFPKWRDIETQLLDYLNVKYVVTLPRGDLHDPQRYTLVYEGRDGRVFENTTALPRFYTVPNVILEFRNDRYVQLLQQQHDWANTALLKNLPVENDQMRLDLLAPRPKSSLNATLRMTSAGVDDFRMNIAAPRYSFVVSSIPWWPGWKVERNGRAINPIRVNGAFLGFAVPPGRADVRVSYSPMTFLGGVWLSAATILALAVFPVWRRRSRRRTS